MIFHLLKFVLSFQLFVACHAQITKNDKFAISLQYLKKKVSDVVDFLPAYKHECFLLLKDGQASQS